MMSESQLTKALWSEASRIEEDALHSMKGHLNAGARWEHVHLALGLPTVILAAWAAIDAFSGSPVMTSILALLAAALAATTTFLDPKAKATAHRNAGKQFNVLKNRARRFREVDLLQSDGNKLNDFLRELCETRDSLNSMSPDIPRWAYEKAKKDIDAGLAEYRVDREAGAV